MNDCGSPPRNSCTSTCIWGERIRYPLGATVECILFVVILYYLVLLEVIVRYLVLVGDSHAQVLDAVDRGLVRLVLGALLGDGVRHF